MSPPDSAPTQDITHPGELYGFLEAFTLPGGVSLCFESGDGAPWPVVVMNIVQEDSLCLDISAVREIVPRLRRGETFQLMGQVEGAMLTTQSLVVREWHEQGERLLAICDYPQSVSVVHRRQNFRASLRADMEVGVTLRVAGEDTPYKGRLCNLSLGGCLVELPLAAAAALKPEQTIDSIRLTFPNQRHFELPASVRHVSTDEAWTQAQAGCEFIDLSSAMERLVWYCVKEVERESARTVMHTGRPLEPSTLFQSSDAAQHDTSHSRQAKSQPQPGGAMASRLQKVTDYLNAQLVQLKSGKPVASTQLSRSTDTLLALWQQDRQALLYASACFTQESHLVQHSLMVAVRMLDLAQSRLMAPERLKAVVACTLLHDLGKGMLPDVLLRDEVLSPEKQDQLHTHVGVIRERLDDCRWLEGDVVEQVIGMANERLDGSGYPAGKRGDALPELARMMAVVDVADVMTRPGRAAWTQREVYRHLLTQAEGFDNAWVQRYIRRFGMAPIGSLALYANGALAWVQRHDTHGTPSQVHVVLNTRNPKRRLDQPLSGHDIEQLGALKEIVNAAHYRLTPV
ncbi:HD domain-containing phosphohydrolase [Chromohalobacter sp. 48-RD10]|uniref:HD domain-containing phosphohydrolase n=1 Tax=Chromohalobacter sp. 48-RD10 TaxID=2994063 RepID=UPI0024692E3E|nr:HD domain-containing phosphohydrolase [Chromohalobacter sp. 48-RD10]